MAVRRLAVFLLFSLVCTIASAAPPNVILITLDTTRADRMGFLGSTRGATPNLDSLARQSVVFTRAYAHVPLTTASHATILTGTYPQFNHVVDFGVPLAATLPYLPEILRQRGYHTAAFVGSLVLDPLDGTAPGFDRSFEVYDAGFHLRARGGDRYKTVERRATEVVNHALAWLGKRPPGPFFLWVHLYDAHDPYDPPPPFKKRFSSDPYDGEIAYSDSEVGKLLTVLRTLNLYDGSLIAVMSDHGEAFGEHGERTHGVFLYDETIHVPLLFKLPAAGPGGRRIETRAGLVDVAPTILQVSGIPVPKIMQGQALLGATPAKVAPAPALSGVEGSRRQSSKKAHGPTKQDPARLQKSKDPPQDRPVYAETDYPHRAFGWSPLRALRAGKYLYIQAPERELYDQSADPQALRNVAPESKAVTETLASQLDDFRRKTGQSLVALAKPDPEQVQKLQALGYVASDTSQPGGTENSAGADPKKKIEVANLLHFAMLDVEDGRYNDAIPKLERVLAEQPEMPVAQMQMGIAQSRLKNYQKALAPLQKAVELRPESGMGHYELGLAFFETGDWKAAAPEFEAAVARAPRWADAHFSLAAVYARIDRVPEAMTELDTTLGLNADHYRANLLRGRILSLQKNPGAALANLEKAVQVQPDSREAHMFLAEAYAQLGREADAQRERAAAHRLGGGTQR